jgi:hypothetical protein
MKTKTKIKVDWAKLEAQARLRDELRHKSAAKIVGDMEMMEDFQLLAGSWWPFEPAAQPGCCRRSCWSIHLQTATDEDRPESVEMWFHLVFSASASWRTLPPR